MGNIRRNENIAALGGLRIFNLRHLNIDREEASVLRRNVALGRNDFSIDNGEAESNYRFILGFFLGFLLALYALIFLIFCQFRRKFRLGMILGMFCGSLMFLFYNISNKS